LPFLFGGAAGLMLGRRNLRMTVVVALVLGVAASVLNGEVVDALAPVFLLIDGVLAFLGYTAAVAVAMRLRCEKRDASPGRVTGF
jgi:hypothetical protein